MRDAIRDALMVGDTLNLQRQTHLGLAYDVYAPTDVETGKVPEQVRAGWLEQIARDVGVPDDYAVAGYGRLLASFACEESMAYEAQFESRLLVGHGNPSGAEVGLTLHRTWGVPMIPGSTLKGIANHYLDVRYGREERQHAAPRRTVPEGSELEQQDFEGVGYREGRAVRAPGAVHRTLFGAPDVGDKDAPGAISGLVEFHDALWVPRKESAKEYGRLVEVDVLTVHQSTYYRSAGESGLPNDYDSPIPVSFLTVPPGSWFLIPVTGPIEWVEFALKLLRAALIDWGVGGKTTAGYGRLKAADTAWVERAKPPLERNDLLEEFEAWLEDPQVPGQEQATKRHKLEYLDQHWVRKLSSLTREHREVAAKLIKNKERRGKVARGPNIGQRFEEIADKLFESED